MLRQLTARTPAARSFSRSAVALVEQPNKSDSFREREAANENAYVKKHEAEQLKKLREQLEQQKNIVNKLQDEIKDLKK